MNARATARLAFAFSLAPYLAFLAVVLSPFEVPEAWAFSLFVVFGYACPPLAICLGMVSLAVKGSLRSLLAVVLAMVVLFFTLWAPYGARFHD